ncbi:PAS domain-containing hybrid sensor histidine kinase/response regulator [Rubellimicrobium arenae]|uniref:PAS domain-containing hybrid sensor histidine kinase/response regulator n=1 Tax=Rubellimicrobium arenae TaxID=2817372 RepID=UPI001B3091B4|nr:PAS domain-containing hybrid sensor histidine kinase/response regulator [Rubellimicrobium arenae]
MPPSGAPPDETAEDLYESAPVGYLTLDSGGLITRVNGTLAGWLNLDKPALLGQKVQKILTPGARIFYETHCGPILRLEGALRQIALDLRRADGTRLPALMEWRRVDGLDGAPLGYRVMVVDATERRAYERELLDERERARKTAEELARLNADLETRVEARTADLVQLRKIESLGQLTGGVAHDMNNLLTPIVTCLDILSRSTNLSPRQERLLGGATEAAERARILVSRMLTFARRQHLEARPVDLTELVLGMHDLITRSIGPLIELHVQADPDLPLARVDPNQLELAILNLSVNARDAMNGQGHLTLRLGTTLIADGQPAPLPAGRYMSLVMRDTGAGMDAATLARATEPFFTTKAPGHGTGLGLSMVHGLAEQSGGALFIESVPQAGTTVTILLPLASEAVRATPAPPAPSYKEPVQRLRILLVDDDELVRSSVAAMLDELGHDVRDVATPLLALNEVNAAYPDLLISDFAMPGMTGLALIQAARQQRPSLPVLLVTGFANLPDLDATTLPRLSKPFSRAELASAIAQAAHVPNASLAT